jgi:hypothetical protein
MTFRNQVQALDTAAAKLTGGHKSDHEIDGVPTLRVGADTPGRGVELIPATRGGGTA